MRVGTAGQDHQERSLLMTAMVVTEQLTLDDSNPFFQETLIIILILFITVAQH